MSAIFKDRKIPRHLIIEDNYEPRLPRRRHRGVWLGTILLLAIMGLLSLQIL